MADYPFALWPGNTRGGTLNVAETHTTWHDEAQAEIRAIEAELGLSPSGSFATVLARLNAVLHLTGGTVTGHITSTAGTPTDDEHLTKRSYVTGYAVAANGDVMTGDLQVGGDPTTPVAGVLVRSDGAIVNALTVAGGSTDATSNLFMDREGLSAGEPGAVGGVFISFRRATTQIGSIAIAAGPTTVYNTSSDYRLKHDLGPIEDALSRLRRLRPRRITWREDPQAGEFDAFLAHEVAEVVPGAVTGVKDAVLPDDDKFDPGGIDPQMIDLSKMVPLLVAAVQELTARNDELTARIDALTVAA